LVLRVRGEELRPVREVVDHRRYVVVVVTPPEKRREIVVAVEVELYLAADLALAARCDAELTVEANIFRNVEQLFLTLDADRVQHRRRLGVGMWRERASAAGIAHRRP